MTKRSEEAETFRQAQKEALEEMKTDSEDETEDDSSPAITKSESSDSEDRGDITDLPTQLEQELRLLQRRTTGFIDIEVRRDKTFATIKYETGHGK